jgi:hypothetical protein
VGSREPTPGPGPFQPGNTIGRGRPKGSRNKPKSPEQQLWEQYATAVLRKCIAMAIQGNTVAMRLCMERMMPARRHPLIQVSLPEIHGAQDLDRAAAKLTQAVQRGKITPEEGQRMTDILQVRSRLIQDRDMEERLARLESALGCDFFFSSASSLGLV